MRDRVKTEQYFHSCIISEEERIANFLNVFNKLEESNQIGINRGKVYLSNFYKNIFKLKYSYGNEIKDIIPYFINHLIYYKDICTPNDSMYDIIDMLSIGVLLTKQKNKFLPYLQEIMMKFSAEDGLILCLFNYLEETTIQKKHSQLEYFNQLIKAEDKAKILSLELTNWYYNHKGAYWYNSHESKNDTYCGYWCFEIAALAKIFMIDDSQFQSNKYYPTDLANYER